MVLLVGDMRVCGSTIRNDLKLDHMCLDNQSHHSLAVIEFYSGLCDSQLWIP